MRVTCLAQEYNTVSLARARTWTARSVDECTNHEATAPTTILLMIYLQTIKMQFQRNKTKSEHWPFCNTILCDI